jgi:DNA-binding XRE family transcriptional regulator
MPKRTMKAHSQAARRAVALLGRLIHIHRIEAKMPAEELATRAGISRALLYRIEKGDPTCSIGAAFEAAVISGVPLFDQDGTESLAGHLKQTDRELRLLPRAVRRPRKAVHDDF